MSTRRAFLGAATTALSQFRVSGANERIRFGVIGAGDRGAYHAERLQKRGPHFLEAKQRFFDSGLIGKVALIRTYWIGNRGFFRHPPKDFSYRPGEIDWSHFLGRAPKRPFDAQRYFGWTMFQDYSTGQ